jgi:hypothetical protein
MKRIFLLLTLFLSTNLYSQIIKGKEGTFDVRNDYSTVSVFFTTHILNRTEVSFDGYDVVKINKKVSQITDGNRLTKGKTLWKLSKQTSFWITFMEKYGYKLSNNTKTPSMRVGDYTTSGTTMLVFNK